MIKSGKPYYQVLYNPTTHFVENREDGQYIVMKEEYLPEGVKDIAEGPYDERHRLVADESVPIVEFSVGKPKPKS